MIGSGSSTFGGESGFGHRLDGFGSFSIRTNIAGAIGNNYGLEVSRVAFSNQTNPSDRIPNGDGFTETDPTTVAEIGGGIQTITINGQQQDTKW